ncbi:MAG: site-specific integrase, partial [Oscillospiraceae bacterium]|nr:site-specific integrase [Oscillospiraceae bacterium]
LSYQRVKRMCNRIRVDTDFSERITPQRFRTTVLTDIYDATKDVKAAQAAAGHTTSAMTLKHYVKGRTNCNQTAAALDHVYCS